MDWLLRSITAAELETVEVFLSDWMYLISLVFLVVELIRYAVQKRLTWSLAGDTLTNFVTQGLFIVITFTVFVTFYLSVLFFAHQFAPVTIETNVWTLGICILLADFAYYWEHRFSHRVAVAWATHTVHHSSPHFNMSVAYRFGPLDALWPVFFSAPIVLLGFDPFAVLFAEAFVLLYQTVLHTEVIGKLPKPIEAVFNTPSHHRVHHGANPEYIDKNYGGMLIVWDRLFGTFAEEREEVVFGLTKPLNSVNPFVVFFHGLTRLAQKVRQASGLRGKLAELLKAPS